MPKDSCYHSVKARYDVFPSARASQAIAKCRKSKGAVRKTSKGSSLKRWQKEKWTDTKSGKPCGAGGSNEYCRPKKKVSQKTPKTIGEISKSKLAAKKAEKSRVGMGNRVTSLSALDELLEFSRDEEWRVKGGPSKEAKENLRAILRYNKHVTPNNQQTKRMQKLEEKIHALDPTLRYLREMEKHKGFMPFGKKAKGRRMARKQMNIDIDYVNEGIRNSE